MLLGISNEIVTIHEKATKPPVLLSETLFYLGRVELDMGFHLQVFIMRTMNLIFDRLLQIGHLSMFC